MADDNPPLSPSSPTLLAPVTESHILATAQHEASEERPVGAAQNSENRESTGEVKDLGWHRQERTMDDKEGTEKSPLRTRPLVGGLRDDEVFTLIRRFNKQIFHIRAIDHAPPGNLDLHISEHEEFSPDKLRSTLERFYVTVIVSAAAFGKHVARLRSWHEPRRTGAFAAGYFLAWLLRVILPASFLLLLVLILSPRARTFLFPPAPLALVSAKTGTVQTPPAGQLGSKDSLTGAPETNEGEAVEMEATNFVAGLAGIAVSTAAGKSEGTGADEVPLEGEDVDDVYEGDEKAKKATALAQGVPDPTDIALNASAARRQASVVTPASGTTGITSKAPHDHVDAADATAAPVHSAMSDKLVPFMRILNDLCDTFERLGNALSPSPPFPLWRSRLKLAGIVAPAFLGSFLLTPDLIVRSATFGAGAAFFALPWIEKAAAWFDHKYPGWRKALELRNHILSGVPTNAQLTVTLLRIGEVNKAPLPPPPFGTLDKPADKGKHEKVDAEDLGMEGVEQAHVDAATRPDQATVVEAEADAAAKKKEKKKSSGVLGVVKGITRGTVSTLLGADRFKAAAGSQHAKRRLGVVASGPPPSDQGPIEFVARYKGKKGKVIVSVASTTPCVGWVHEGEENVTFESLKEVEVDEEGKTDAKSGAVKALEKVKAKVEQKGEKTVKPVWSLQVEDIRELKKIGGLGWKGKLVVGWALGMPLTDGLEITDREGKRFVVTAVRLREELFNRLVAMASQKWEVC